MYPNHITTFYFIDCNVKQIRQEELDKKLEKDRLYRLQKQKEDEDRKKKLMEDLKKEKMVEDEKNKNNNKKKG